MNSDCIVNFDMAIIAKVSCQVGDGRWNQEVDISKDEVVNKDVVIAIDRLNSWGLKISRSFSVGLYLSCTTQGSGRDHE